MNSPNPTEQITDSAALLLDKSWPDPLPTDGALRDIFFHELGADAGQTPHDRLNSIRPLIFKGDTFSRVTRDLHRLLSVQNYWNRPHLSGRDVMRGSREIDPLVRHMGIDRELDVRKAVIPALRPLIADVMTSDQPAQGRLDIVAMTMGTVIAESQSFSDANTRIARSVHDYIKHGLDGLEMKNIANVERNFTPPNVIEELIMMQNLTQFIEYPQQPLLGEGVTKISNRVIDMYMQAAGAVTTIRQLNGEENYSDRVALTKRINAHLSQDNEGIASRASAVLLQKHYASAAVAAAYKEHFLHTPLSVPAMEHLVSTNIDLMKMRVVSLGVGMARKGLFVSVETPDEYSDSPFRETYWQSESI